MAEEAFHFYSMVFTKVGETLTSHVGNTASAVISAITPVVTTLMVIYVFMWGWSMMRGVISEPITDGLARILRLTFIVTLALQIGYYNSFLADFLWNSPDAMASVIASGGGTSAGTGAANAAYLDELYTRIYKIAEKFYTWAYANNKWLPDFGAMAAYWLLVIIGLASTGYAAFLYVLSKVALAVLLGIGPIFIIMLIFEPTNRFFDAWIGQALNYDFLVILSASAIKLMFDVLGAYLTPLEPMAGTSPQLAQIVPAVAILFISLLVLIQVPGIASALGGGVAVGTLGAVRWAFDKTAGAGASVARPLMNPRKTLANMRADRMRRASAARWAKANPGLVRRMARRVRGN